MRLPQRNDRRPEVAPSVVVSPWVLGGMIALGAAWFVDQALGGTTSELLQPASPLTAPWRPSLGYVAMLGLAPIATAVAFATSIRLASMGRRHAAAALMTASVVAALFSMRSFAVADVIGWRAAATEALVAGRTAATTVVAVVCAVVLYREGMIGRPVTLAIAGVAPAVIGVSRIILGIHPISHILGQWFIGALMALAILCGHMAAMRRIPRLVK